ncbi:MAG: CapA family protein [Pyrinomonadaceae bacterium]
MKFLLTTSVALAAAFILIVACGGSAEVTTPRASAEQMAEASPTPNKAGSITIAAVGDIMLGSTSINETFLPPNDGRDMLDEVAPVLSAADIAFGNLEGPLIDGGVSEKCGPPPRPKAETGVEPAAPPVKSPAPTKPIRCFAFRTPTRYGQYLKDAGFDVLSLANNHANDFGEEGRASTRRVLDALGIKHAGSDRSQFPTAYLDVKGVKVAVVAFAHNAIVPNVNELDAARDYVAAARKKADIVIVSFHGGAEGEAYQHVPRRLEMLGNEKRGNLPLFARTVIDAGADLVLGHGPHVLRGIEFYKGKPVAYSMGNFATYGMFNLKGAQGISAIFEFTLGSDGRFITGKIVPTRQEGRGIPALDPTGAAIRKLRELSTADFGPSAARIADDGTVTMK